MIFSVSELMTFARAHVSNIYAALGCASGRE
jgi:hypothetical protein